jgi:NAD+ synthase
MKSSMAISPDVLKIDPATEADRIVAAIRNIVFKQLRRKGVVVGVSGGIDSAVVAFLCTRAIGKDRVLSLSMPENDSSCDSLRLGRMVADGLGIRHTIEDIGSILKALRCYERRDQLIRTLVPEYGEGCKSKIVLPNVLDTQQYSIFSVVVQLPTGETKTVRLNAKAYLGIVAATNFKQRARKMIEY